VKQNQK